MSLVEDLAQWDGKHVADLETTFQRRNDEPDFLSTIVGLLAEPELQRAATWLLKRWKAFGGVFPLDESRSIVAGLDHLVGWESQLHVLQFLDVLPLEPSDLPRVERFVSACLQSPHTFVRAWSYSGLCTLARLDPQYRPEAERLLTLGEQDAAASVRARLRREVKQGWD